jgi:hypothetical protein
MSKPLICTHKFRTLTSKNRLQDTGLDGSTLKFETLDQGGDYSDMFPNAVKVTDPEGRWCIYTPIEAGGQQVQSLGFFCSEEDEPNESPKE